MILLLPSYYGEFDHYRGVIHRKDDQVINTASSM
ncbi:hypothetical protein ACP70R_014824 [Stipagrostis hirtigluma subsp. patula]